MSGIYTVKGAAKYWAAARTSVRNRLAYRGNFAGGLFTYGLFVFVFSRIWAAAYAGRATIADTTTPCRSGTSSSPRYRSSVSAASSGASPTT